VSAHATQPLRLPRFQLVRVTRSPLLRLIGRRLLAAIPVLWGVTFLTFLAMNALPGDAAQQLLGANATPDQVHRLEVKLGLDQPFLTRYWDWFKGVIHGDLGHSLASGQSVTHILGQGLPITFELIAYAFVFSLLFALPLALLSARRPNGIGDRLTMLLSMAGLSIANYVLALLLVWLFAVELGWLPALGWVPPGESIVQNLRYLTLPAISIGLPLLCFYTRLLRADLLEQLQSEDYVVTARAKGVGPWAVLMRHTLRNSVFGLITIVALNLGTLLGVTVIIEDIFSVPGMGRELLSAINTRDVPVVEGAVLVFAVVVVVANFAADVLYSMLDPRIRYGGTRS
jgi:peptide/nickel transport system permease protein